MNRWVFFGIFLILFASIYGEGSFDKEENEAPRVFRIAHPMEQEPLDPHFFSSPASARLWNALFEGLVETDPRTGEGVPGLAESWDISPDGRIYTFHFRESRWNDGTPVTAVQAALSWKRILGPSTDSPYAWYPVMFIKGAAAFHRGEGLWKDVGILPLDDRTLQVELSGSYPFFISALVHQSFAVLPMHLVEKDAGWSDPDRIVGNGDYAVQKPLSEGRIVLSRTTPSRGRDSSVPKDIIFSRVEDSLDAVEQFKAGGVDWVPADLFPKEQIAELQYQDGFVSSSGLTSYFYIFNAGRTPLKDNRVRRALSLAVDRELMVDTVLRGKQIPAYSLVPGLAGYSALKPFPQDKNTRLEEAQNLLQEAGYPDGKGFPVLSLMYLETEGHRAVAECLKEQWNETLHVEVSLSGREPLSYYNDRKNGEFDLSLGGWQGLYQDPFAFLSLFLTGNPVFGASYSNRDSDRLLVDSSLLLNRDERYEKLREAENLLSLQDTACLPLFFDTKTQLIDLDQWDGFYTNPLDRHPLEYIRRIEN